MPADADFPRFYKAGDAFVLPTRGEGWGRPHVEAMSMGLPVISTNWSGITGETRQGLCSVPERDGCARAGGDGLCMRVRESGKWAKRREELFHGRARQMVRVCVCGGGGVFVCVLRMCPLLRDSAAMEGRWIGDKPQAVLPSRWACGK